MNSEEYLGESTSQGAVVLHAWRFSGFIDFFQSKDLGEDTRTWGFFLFHLLAGVLKDSVFPSEDFGETKKKRLLGGVGWAIFSLLHERMGSCCTKSLVKEEEERNGKQEQKFSHQNHYQHGVQTHQEQQHVVHNHYHAREQGAHYHHYAKEQEHVVELQQQQPGGQEGGKKEPPPPAVHRHSEGKKTKVSSSSIKDNNSVPLGKKTNFGYARDFKAKYTLGKLLGHGQFGYTYVAVEKATGMRVAVKTIEKKQVCRPPSTIDIPFFGILLIMGKDPCCNSSVTHFPSLEFLLLMGRILAAASQFLIQILFPAQVCLHVFSTERGTQFRLSFVWQVRSTHH